MNKSRFKSLWWVMKGLAVAPPACMFIMGVSTSRKPRLSKYLRTPLAITQNKQSLRDDLGTDDELVADVGIHDEIQISLTVTGFGVGETDERLGKHVETGREDLDGGGEDTQLTTLGTTRETLDTDDISTTDRVVSFLESFAAAFVFSLASHDLELLTFLLEGVEEELLARSTLENHTTSNGDDFVGKMFAVLAVGELLNKFRKRIHNFEFVGIVGVSGFFGLLNSSKSVFKIFGGVDVFLVFLLLNSRLRVSSSLSSLFSSLGSLFGLLLLHLFSSLELVLTQLL